MKTVNRIRYPYLLTKMEVISSVTRTETTDSGSCEYG